MIFVSDQAFISKWWWIGAIRKIRRPQYLNEKTCRITESASITKMPADQEQEQLAAAHDRERADRAADCHGAGVPHLHLGGEGVVPEEPDRSSDQRGPQDRHVQGGQVLLGLELPRPRVGDDVHRREGEQRDDPDPGGEAVDPVRQVRAVRRPGHDQKEQEVEAEREPEAPVHDRHVELARRVHLLDRESEPDSDRRQEDELPATGEAERAAVPELRVVVHEADGAAAEHHAEDGQSLGRVVAQRQEGDGRREDQQQSAHGRRPLLDLVALGALLADVLAHLVPAEELDELRSGDDRDEHCEQARGEDSFH